MRPGLLCPGRARTTATHKSRRMRFNEAGAVMPRKGGAGAACLAVPPPASMRPGLLCPGRGGRRQQVMAARHASMRPGLLCPGRGRPPSKAAWKRRKASMRPGLLCPGRAGRYAAGASPQHASMRPGLLCPGRAARRCRRRPRSWRFNEAGAVMPRKEWSRSTASASPSARFNEAGAVMPRKVRDLHLPVIHQCRFNEAGAVMPRKAESGQPMLARSARLQ